jgi:poly-beta-1,6-N-acetyl-D-glucosamine synthase
MSLHHLLAVIDTSIVYRSALGFTGIYPIFMALVWILCSTLFFFRQERAKLPQPGKDWPFVSILIPAYAEEDFEPSLDALLTVDYPNYEVIVINDGSPDRTAEVVRTYLGTGLIRLLDKKVNEGKSMALNDALPLCRGEIVLILDADIIVHPNILRILVPHFLSGRVGAVAGNPRVLNRKTLLQKLQAAEFSAIMSMERRAQRVWGRVMTVSGAVAAFRRSAILDVGGFSPDMATEDIDLTWRLQMRFWDVRYEPRAVVWMQVPPSVVELWKQRRRWARGLAQVLRRNWSIPFRWKMRRLWPVWFESAISVLWAYTMVAITCFWVVSRVAGYVPYGASPIPNYWGMTIATACLAQLFVGALMDRAYDKRILSSMPEAIYYPFVYWILMSLITSIYTLDGFFRKRPQLQTWKIRREVG